MGKVKYLVRVFSIVANAAADQAERKLDHRREGPGLVPPDLLGLVISASLIKLFA